MWHSEKQILQRALSPEIPSTNHTFHCAHEIKVIESSSPAPRAESTVRANHARTLKLMCTAGNREMQDLSLFKEEIHSGHPAACRGSYLKSIIEMKGSSPGSEKWQMKSLSFTLVWNSIWLEGIFIQLLSFKKTKKSVSARAMLFLFKHLNILLKGEWRIKLLLLLREEWWFRNRMVFAGSHEAVEITDQPTSSVS